MEEFQTKVISFGSNNKKQEIKKEYEEGQTSTIKKVLYNVNDEVIHPEEAYPVTKVQVVNPTKRIDLRKLEEINPKANFIPAFYKKELKWHKFLVWVWVMITALVIGFETWGLIEIYRSNQSNWLMLLLIPGLAFALSFLILYSVRYVNFRNEARNIDFSQGKPQSINVEKLYKRLKVAHINVNWFTGISYIYCAVGLIACFCVAHKFTDKWGDISPTSLAAHGGPAILITVIVLGCVAAITLFLHIFLLIKNYARCSRIDNYYNQQLIPDAELAQLKKDTNKRDFIIFFVCIMVLVLVGIVIYRLVKSKKVNNNVTITNI